MHKHKHAELIKLWADGHEIQFWHKSSRRWLNVARPTWSPDTSYRLKADAWKDKFIEAIHQGKTVEVFIHNKWGMADSLHRLVKMDELEHYGWLAEECYRIRQDPVYVYAYSHHNVDEWYVASKLMTECEAEKVFLTRNLRYKKLQTI